MATAIKKNRTAPTGATYLTKTDETSSLPNSFDLGGLATGILWSDVAAGVATPRRAVPDTDYQSANANLISISLLGTAADKMLYTTGIDTWAEADITSLARNLLDDSTQAAMATTILSGATLTAATVASADKIIGQDADDSDNVKTFTAQDIADLAGGGGGVAPVDATYITQTPNATLTAEQALSLLTAGLLKQSAGTVAQAIEGTDYYAPAGTDVAVTDGGTGASTASGARTNLGVAIGSDVQAYDATLQSISSLGTAADKYMYTTGVDTWAEGDITALARSLLDDSTQATMAGTILSGATLTAATVAGTDKILGQDASDSDNIKTFTAQDIANLATSGAPTSATYITQTPDATLSAEQALSLLSNGLLKHTAGVVAQAIAGTDYLAPSAIGVTVQGYDATLAAWAAFNTNGILTQTAADTFTGRTITGTASEITVTNGNGVSGNPTLSLPSSLTFTGKTITGGTFASMTHSTGSIGSAVTGTTQAANDNSTKLATTAYVDTAVSGSGAGLVFLASATIASDSVVSFDNVFDSTYDQYLIIANRIVPSTDGINVAARAGTGATPTYHSGGTDYAWGWTGNTTSSTGDQSTGASSMLLFGSFVVQGNASGELINFTCWVYDPQNATHTYIGGNYSGVTNTGYQEAATFSGRYKSTTAVTSIQFLPSSGNFTTGTIRVYGIVNS